MVISVGGGAVVDKESMTRLKSQSRIAWLTCSPEVLCVRIESDASLRSARPALTAGSQAEEVRTVLARREPLYRAWADVAFSTEHRAAEAVAVQIAAWVSAAEG